MTDNINQLPDGGTIEAAKAFCHHGKSAFAFDPIVLKFMAEFADEQTARLVSERDTLLKAVESIRDEAWKYCSMFGDHKGQGCPCGFEKRAVYVIAQQAIDSVKK